MTTLKRALSRHKLVQLGEFVAVFMPAFAALMLVPLVGDAPLARHGIFFVANLLMMVLVWLGLRLRGQGCEHFGVSFRFRGSRLVIRAVLQSFVVVVAAVAAVAASAIVMAVLFGRPEGADMSGLDYLRGNLPLVILVLAAVYLNASFGEELIYRAFLINRIAELGSGSRVARWSGVLVSSLVFGLIHSDWAIVGVVQMAAMGLVLGVSYLTVGRNLWVTILAHGYLDTILILQVYFGTT